MRLSAVDVLMLLPGEVDACMGCPKSATGCCRGIMGCGASVLVLVQDVVLLRKFGTRVDMALTAVFLTWERTGVGPPPKMKLSSFGCPG